MLTETLIEVLMRRDAMIFDEARDLLEDLAQEVRDGADPEEVLMEYGLDPDYIFDLMEYL